MPSLVDQLLATQHECLGVWQLVEQQWTDAQIRHRLPRAGLRPVPDMDGVWTSARGELTALQRWSAATRTAPGTVLAGVSGGRYRRIIDRPYREHYVIVTRQGTSKWRRHGDILVTHTPNLIGEVVDGIPVVPVPRMLMDMAPHLDDKELRRAVIEALRLRLATVEEIRAELPRRRGASRLRRLLDLVQDLPIARCKSNAEGTALVRRKQAGRPIPEVNVRVGRYEADLVDHERKEITEIDGPAHHADPDHDETRNVHWRGRSYTVHRRPSDDAYDDDAVW